jgi:DNA-directed RNA polymerase subunit RPC12/RpoP
MVTEELICPDCGGVVGATETTEAGPPCKCFTAPPVHEAVGDAVDHAGNPLGDPTDQSETVADAPSLPVEQVAPAKICRICKKDVSGEKRVKDRLGYYCLPCAKEEEKKEHQGRVRCRACGRLVKEENLILYEGTKMCSTCHKERIDLQKAEIKRMGFKAARTRAEIQKMYGMIAALIVLSLFMAYGAYRLVHH